MGLESLFWTAGKNGVAGSLAGLGTFGLSMAPMLLGGLFNRQDPLRQMQARAQGFLNPNYINNLSNTMYRDTLGGAGFAQASRAAAAGAGQFQRALRPLGGNAVSGIGNLRSAMGASLMGNKMASLYGAADLAARESARALAQAQANAVFAGGVPQNYTTNLASAGLNAMLLKYLSGASQAQGGQDIMRQLAGLRSGQWAPQFGDYPGDFRLPLPQPGWRY